MYRYIVGLDIGSSKVCASMGKVNSEGTMQIMGITSVSCSGLKKGAVVDIDVTSEAIEKCIFNLEKIVRSEEHTSELQSRQYLVCRLLLEKKKTSILLLLSFTPT